MKPFCFALFLFILYSCSNSKTKRTELIHFAPKNAVLIIKTTSLEGLKNSIQNSALLNEISKTNSYRNLKETLENVSLFETEGDVLICFSENKPDSLQYSVITKYSENIFLTDSLSDYKEETLTYKNKSIKKQTLKGNTFYSTLIDSTFFVSSSKELIELAFNKSDISIKLEKIYNSTSNDKTLSVILKQDDGGFLKSFFINDSISPKSFTNYIAVDVDINQDEMYINGITKAFDSSRSFINIFKNNIPQINHIQNITPSNSAGFMSFTFLDFMELETNLVTFNNLDSIPDTTFLFDDVIEVGVIYEAENRTVVLNSMDVISTKDALIGEQNKESTFRQVDIFTFSKPGLFTSVFSPLITSNSFSKYCVLDDFFVFSEKLATLQNIIANYQNKTTLSELDYFKNIKKDLSDESSLMMVINPSILGDILNKNLNGPSSLKLEAYKASALQFTYDNDFAHVNGIIKKAKTRAFQNSISEEFTIKLNTDLLNNPEFVTNHLTKQKEIIVQDINNNLYLISNRGIILWKKQLNGPVLGSVEQIDIYKNGRLQLAFATPSRVYVLDRNGKDVAPFPLKFNDKITQPLSVFDYDKNKNYRLLVTQGKNVLMYNAHAKIVDGFTYKSANNSILSQPQHFRIGSKDYIVLKTTTKLYILGRTGKPRVKAKTTSTFSNEGIYLFKNKFTTTTQDGNLILVDTKGNTSTQNLKLSDRHHIETTSKTLVSQSDNRLSIKGKTIALDYGNYTAPKLFYINDKIYVSITDLQAQKIYLYDSRAKLQSNFPVYGNSIISLDNIDSDKNLEFIAKGESNSLILYQIN